MARWRSTLIGSIAITGAIVGVSAASAQVGGVTVPSLSTPVGSTPAVAVPSVATTVTQVVSSVAGPVTNAPAVALPAVPVPQVTVPSVTVPPVRTPVVSTPAVTTPTVTTPAARTPAVTAPAPATTPLPAVAVPSTSAPSVATPAGTAGPVTVRPSVPSRPAQAMIPTAVDPSAIAGSGEPASAPTAAPTSTSPLATDLAIAGGQRSTATPAQRLRALRRAVLKLEVCLNALPAPEREVLTLRAGVGLDHARTQRRVAQLSDRSLADVRRLERSGLRHLRSLHGEGCVQAASSSTLVAPVGITPTTATPGGDGGAIAVLGERDASPAPRPQDRGAEDQPGRRTDAPAARVAEQGNAAPDPALLLIPIVVLAFVMFAGRELRRTLNRT